jgi:hypothetical protein
MLRFGHGNENGLNGKIEPADAGLTGMLNTRSVAARVRTPPVETHGENAAQGVAELCQCDRRARERVMVTPTSASTPFVANRFSQNHTVGLREARSLEQRYC